MKYPEGWAQQGSGPQVTIRDKNNIVRIVVSKGAAPTAAAARHDLAATKGATLKTAPQTTTISGEKAVKVVYSTESAPNPVTGKRVTLLVDRFRGVVGRAVGGPDADGVPAARMSARAPRPPCTAWGHRAG
jgi:hypothetical protein